ncbi:glycine zipper family protein [Criblamydia sequanensis]|uniref:Uncharacterized protein n=1 Tax=Candidatus Criblamydia sequanensis CRIB-18 TaxID=1437425 RepID=A0A090D088_9BACT|nr:glycine zipper family protein [Criblamydia sequanensis]CDR32973.1 conserved hypothetical protein [Criblamydia sequanensis CRIB-18]
MNSIGPNLPELHDLSFEVIDSMQESSLPFFKELNQLPETALEVRAFKAIKASNIYPNKEEKERALEMASYAAIMYRELDEIEEVFGNQLLPTPTDLGVFLPTGLKLQAFGKEGEVVLAIRGTELDQDLLTMIKNLIADMGIGRHKSNEDLYQSIQKVNERVSTRYGYEIEEGVLEKFKALLEVRVLGDNDSSRVFEVASRVAKSIGEGIAKGGAFGVLTGGIIGAAALGIGLASFPIAATAAGAVGISGAFFGGGINGASETVQCLTVMDGYPTLLSYVKATDDYIVALRERGLINQSVKLTVVGHSLAGYLAATTATQADEIHAFNGPGLRLDTEMSEICNNLGWNRKINPIVEYHSYSMETDFIGNLCTRTGPLRTLTLPITFDAVINDFPACNYKGPLAHHGIMIIRELIRNSSIIGVEKPLALTYPKKDEGEKEN